MKIFDGKKESEKRLKGLGSKIKKEKLKPHLAVFLVGNDKPSKIYVDLKRRAAEKIGMKFSLYKYKKDISQKEIIKKIEELNNDPGVTGMIVQLPLPYGFDAKKVVGKIDPKKDVDGSGKKNLRALKAGESIKIKPVPAQAVLEILDAANIKNIKDKKIKAVVNSKFFSDVLRDLFSLNEIKIKTLIAKDLSKDKISNFTRDADVLISAIGRKELIKDEDIKDGAILIDIGITKKGNRVYGDIDMSSCSKKASFITPVPGGVGPMVIAGLLENVVEVSR